MKKNDDSIRILNHKVPADPLIRFVGAGVQLDFEDFDVYQGFIDFLLCYGYRIEVNNKNILFFKKGLSDGSNDGRISDSETR